MSFSASLVIAVLYFTKTRGESLEDQSSFVYDQPSTMNFNEIFSTSFSMLNDETLTTVSKDEEFHLNNVPSRLVEFQPLTTTSSTPRTTPKPRFLTANYLKTTTRPKIFFKLTPISKECMTRAEQNEQIVQVLPLENRGRGVLDLLFPATRVRGFKNVFETFRRMMSSTF